MKPSRLLGPEDRARIEEAVRAAEANTSGEIVVSVKARCGRHAAAPWRLGVSLAAIALLGSVWLPIEGSPVELFVLQLAALAIAYLACLLDPIRHAFVSERELQTKAEAAALHAFHEHGLRRTEGRTGILIFVALFEHRVVVLADEAIDQALGPDEEWETLVEAVLGGIRRGRAADGIIEAVEQCGALLAHPLPAAPDDRNEIPHGLVLVDE